MRCPCPAVAKVCVIDIPGLAAVTLRCVHFKLAVVLRHLGLWDSCFRENVSCESHQLGFRPRVYGKNVIVWWDGALTRDRARGSKREPPGSRDRCQRDLPCIVWVCEGVSDVTRDRSKVYHFRALLGRVTYNEPNREPPSSSWKVAAYLAVQVCASRFSEL